MNSKTTDMLQRALTAFNMLPNTKLPQGGDTYMLASEIGDHLLAAADPEPSSPIIGAHITDQHGNKSTLIFGTRSFTSDGGIPLALSNEFNDPGLLEERLRRCDSGIFAMQFVQMHLKYPRTRKVSEIRDAPPAEPERKMYILTSSVDWNQAFATADSWSGMLDELYGILDITAAQNPDDEDPEYGSIYRPAEGDDAAWAEFEEKIEPLQDNKVKALHVIRVDLDTGETKQLI